MLMVTGAGAQQRQPKAIRFWCAVDRLVRHETKLVGLRQPLLYLGVKALRFLYFDQTL